MNAFAILGSGFGLYGYAAALASCEQQVILPERYRERYQARTELHVYDHYIEWRKDEKTAIQHSKGIVFALPPPQQDDWLSYCLKQTNIDYLLLEKPLSQSPDAAAKLFDKLISSNKNFRIGYIFCYTKWGQRLLSLSTHKHDIKEISIQWMFLAHHFSQDIQNWKRLHSMGGGVIRFYGIHIIALLAQMGYDEVTLSQVSGSSFEECEKWHACFLGKGLPKLEVVIDSKSSKTAFSIMQRTFLNNERTSTHIQDPFDDGVPNASASDRRIPVLAQHYLSLHENNFNKNDYYFAVIELWRTVEKNTEFLALKEFRRLNEKEAN